MCVGDCGLEAENEIDRLVEDCSNSSVLALELLQSCTKLSKWYLETIK